jgi:hypothetical protein
VDFFCIGLGSLRPDQLGIQPQGLDDPEIFSGGRKFACKRLAPLQQLIDCPIGGKVGGDKALPEPPYRVLSCQQQALALIHLLLSRHNCGLRGLPGLLARNLLDG